VCDVTLCRLVSGCHISKNRCAIVFTASRHRTHHINSAMRISVLAIDISERWYIYKDSIQVGFTDLIRRKLFRLHTDNQYRPRHV
jgi:hypothetical protein